MKYLKILLFNIKFIQIVFTLGFTYTNTFASDAIVIDGLFDDWDSIPISEIDPQGDNTFEDFKHLKITNDNNFLFLNLSFYNGDQLLQEKNSVHLYIDTDNNALTGLKINGIGAELELEFGTFTVYYHSSSGRKQINLSDITFRRAPTVSADQFEMGIALNSSVMTLENSQTADTISILFVESDSHGDMLPDVSGGAKYIIDANNVKSITPIPLEKFNKKDIRIVTYNVQNHKSHSLDNVKKREHTKRVLKALNPDIIALQHVHTDSTIDTLIANCFPGIKWYKIGIYQKDKFVFSRYPIIKSKYQIINSYSMDVVLIDTKQELGSNLLLFNTHLEAYAYNDFLRQKAVDNFIQVLRDWRNDCNKFPFEKNAPFVVAGDFNMYGSGQVLRTIRDGDIWNEADFGNDFPPDWDGTSITNIISRHTHTNMGYTWRNDDLPYPPGKLDYIFYSDSKIEIGNHFILNTLAMPDSVLQKYNLRFDDTQVISEHLPHIADIVSFHNLEQYDSLGVRLPCKFKLDNAYPNPFNSIATIGYELAKPSNVKITIYDSIGKKINTLINTNRTAGKYKVYFKGFNFPSGVYYYRLETEKFVDVKKFLLLK